MEILVGYIAIIVISVVIISFFIFIPDFFSYRFRSGSIMLPLKELKDYYYSTKTEEKEKWNIGYYYCSFRYGPWKYYYFYVPMKEYLAYLFFIKREKRNIKKESMNKKKKEFEKYIW